MTEFERITAEWECTRLIQLCGLLIDDGRFEEMAALYAEDGAFARPSAPEDVVRGRAAILAHYRARPPRFTRHFVSNVVVTVESAVAARATSYLMLRTGPSEPPENGEVRSADPACLMATFADRFARVDGQWKFAERLGRMTLIG